MRQNISLIKRYIVFVMAISFMAMGVGFVLGSGAQILYEPNEIMNDFSNGVTRPEYLGGLIGVMMGCLVAQAYAVRLCKFFDKYGLRHGLDGKALLWGILAGVICSCMVHLVLMLLYRNPHPAPLGIGAVFGGGAGLVLGSFSFLILSFYSTKT